VPGVFHVPFPSSSYASRSSDATFDRIDEIFHTVAKPESFAARRPRCNACCTAHTMHVLSLLAGQLRSADRV
jgi:hypothetical protein